MDNIPEREQPKLEREVEIGKEFQPFDQNHVDKEIRGGIELLSSQIEINYLAASSGELNPK